MSNNQRPQSTSPSSHHKLHHLQGVNDKGEFLDQKHHSQVRQDDQAIEIINKVNNTLPDERRSSTKIEPQLQAIQQDQLNEAKKETQHLKHLPVGESQDKDEFNRSHHEGEGHYEDVRKRGLSEPNLHEKMFGGSEREDKKRLNVKEYLQSQNKQIPEKIVEEENEMSNRYLRVASPAGHRQRKKSLSISRSHGSGVEDEINRLKVDEIDKKKTTKQYEKEMMKEQDEMNEIEEIKEEKNQEDAINISKLEESRSKVEKELQQLAKVAEGSKEIPPPHNEHLKFDKQPTIAEEKEENV